MTQPDEAVPPILGAIANPGLATWAAMSQQEWETLMRDSVKSHIDPLEMFINAVQNGLGDLAALIDGIINAITGGNGSLVADAIAAIQNLVGQLGDLAGLFQKLLNGIGGAVGATVEQVVKILTDLAKGFWDFIHGLVGGNGTIAQAVAYITNIFTELHAFIDGVWRAFTGLTGGSKTVNEAITAITSWLTNIFQKLVDGIVSIITPGSTNRPVADAIAAIGSIFFTATNADTSAAQANAAIDAMKAQQAGGFADEFDQPLATDLDAKWQRKTTGLADKYGPNGLGSVVGVMVGTGTGPIRYVQTANPLTDANMRVTAVLSRNPWWDAFVKSGWYLLVQANPTDQSCYGVEIMDTQAKFFSLSPSGVQTDLGSVKTIPANAVGIPYALQMKDNVLSLWINGIQTSGTYTVNNNLGGRCIGFGGHKSPYTNVNDNPLAQFAGISWQPAI